MKSSFLLVILYAAFFSSNISAQQPDSTVAFPGRKPVKITLIANDRRLESLYTKHGIIYSTSDTTLIIALTKDRVYSHSTPTTIVPIENIWYIQRHNKVSTGILLGGAIGALTGVIISPKNAILTAPILGFFGLLYGGIISAVTKTTIPIKGNRRDYAKQRDKLKRLSITGQ